MKPVDSICVSTPHPSTRRTRHRARLLLSPLLAGLAVLTGAADPNGGALDPYAEPHFEVVRLSAGFTPDPYPVEVFAGGSLDVSMMSLGPDCTGFVCREPDVVLYWSGLTDNLTVSFESDEAGGDATLILLTPEGVWLGNDDADSGTLDPRLDIRRPGKGRYAIWVGSLSSGDQIAGTLLLTELNSSDETPLDPSLEPHFATVRLEAGFTPDPHTLEVVGGGPIDVSELDLGFDCTGFVSEAPDVGLDWTGSTDRLRIYFEADRGGDDATLLIHTPDGTWLGNDDADGENRNPMLDLRGHGDGRYSIWIGTYSEGDSIPGTLTITEQDTLPSLGGASSDAVLDPSLDPQLGTVQLQAGFSPDPHALPLVAGGSLDVSAMNLGEDCLGFAREAPDVRLDWTGSTDGLRVYFEAEETGEDATLIVNTPAGLWIGNDDADVDTRNPLLELGSHGEGLYDIWVGTYSEGDGIAGTLSITTQDRRPTAGRAASRDLDVPYVPTPHDVVEAMLEVANVGPQDYVIDLGSGDGRIVIAAAERGASGHGIDLDPARVREAERRAREAGVANRVLFLEGDLFEADISQATVLTMYLLSTVNLRLKPVLFEQLRPGTRVVSHAFTMGDWEADQHLEIDHRDVYYWVIPADARGHWEWQTRGRPFTAAITQQYQRIHPALKSADTDLTVEEALLSGEQIRLTATDPSQEHRYLFSGRINGHQIRGTAQIRTGSENTLEPWSATLRAR